MTERKLVTNRYLAPALGWKRDDTGYVATDAEGTCWSIDQHPTTPDRQGKNPDWSRKWWLHRLDANAQYPTDPAVHDECPLVTGASWTALHRHPEVLRYADALAAGWTDRCWAIGNADWVMQRGDTTAPLSVILGKPEPVDPLEHLRIAERELRYLDRIARAEDALRRAGLPVPSST